MKVTVITVCFNSAASIADTLRSVDTQQGADIEHWVIDGGSSDGTLAEVARHAQPWRHVLSEKDRGIYDAMNKGIQRASGDIVGFINSDDFYADPLVLQSVVQAFKDPNVQACWGDLVYVRADAVDQVVRYWRSSNFQPGSFASGWNPPHPTFFVRRSVYQRLGGFSLDFAMGNDVELMARFLEKHRIQARYLPRLMVKMRLGGASNRSLSAVVLQNRELLRAFKGLGLRASVASLAVGKLLSRGRQFLSRPPQ
jgi:glycosyltransferase involved in cell wall biosynthesis